MKRLLQALEDESHYDCHDRRKKRRTVADSQAHGQLASTGHPVPAEPPVDDDDWKALQELHSAAFELCEGTRPASAAPVLRRLLDQCERSCRAWYRLSAQNPRCATPPADWTLVDIRAVTEPSEHRPVHARDTPAFYVIYGHSLFLMGKLLSRDPRLTTGVENATSSLFFSRALDVLEAGEDRPDCDSADSSAQDDYRLPLTAGRALLHLALDRASRPDSAPSSLFHCSNWPTDSPFASFASPHSPRRRAFANMTAPDILQLAVDHLLRSFFIMPARIPSKALPGQSCPEPISPVRTEDGPRPFSRCRTLCAVGNELLAVAQLLKDATERRYWAGWIDKNIYDQLAAEPDAYKWELEVSASRAHCQCLAASASVDMLQASTDEADVEDCWHALSQAVNLLTRPRVNVKRPDVKLSASSFGFAASPWIPAKAQCAAM